ncbi:hypothetical protein ATHL_00044 [Anaerolinea thermolimosa]|uniref:hypothetical protein n=1 Tax=Anaerolinea thermolimosa TaxID=229919 RepID=UPI0007833331|nr:hypothetical protein [Anaerolinea thermolimosa]GAP05215.1 hypothetical protein ATHL_00044 [Anaerolinea thermolimosa]
MDERMNPYRCRAVGLSALEGRCLVFVARCTPTEAQLLESYPLVYRKLARLGLIVEQYGVYQVTPAGESKLRVLEGGR